MRKLRVLGMALTAMLAISAVETVGASADEITAEKYPTLLTGGRDGSFLDQANTTAGPHSCTTPKYIATISGSTTSISVTPSFTGCVTAGIPSTVAMNGCTLKFNINGGISTTGDADIVCPAGTEITITVTPASGTHPCTIHVKPQSDITGGIAVTNIGVGNTKEITVSAELSGIDYTHTAGSGLAKCTGGSGTTGTFNARAIFTGEEELGEGKHVGIFMSNV